MEQTKQQIENVVKKEFVLNQDDLRKIIIQHFEDVQLCDTEEGTVRVFDINVSNMDAIVIKITDTTIS